MVRLRVLGGGGEVGRSAFLINDGNRGVLLDYGVNFDLEDRPQFPGHVRPIDVSGIVISHAHLDHIGAAPIMYITGRTPAFMTKPTLEISRLLILDFLKVSSSYVEYDLSELENMASNTVIVDYGREYSLDGYTLVATSAGHIIGSLMAYLETPSGHSILYTGDVNTINTWTLSGAEHWPKRVDTIIVETTYGDRKHPPRHLVENQLVSFVEETIDRDGVILIPAFSVGRSQEVLTLIQVELPHVEVYLDGMSREITDIYLKYKEYLRDPNLFERAVENAYYVRGWGDRRRIWKKPCVIIASAGMLKGGPSIYYLKKIGNDPRSAVLLVSYQAPNTPGYRLLSSGKVEEFELENVRAKVHWFDLSSHAGKDGLLSIVRKYRSTLKNVVLVHGDRETSNGFAKIVRESVDPSINVHVPINGEEIELIS